MRIVHAQEFVAFDCDRTARPARWHRVDDVGRKTLCGLQIGRFADNCNEKSEVEKVVYSDKCPLPECESCLAILTIEA